MFSTIKSYATGITLALIGILFAALKIQSSRLANAKQEVKKEKEAAAHAEKAAAQIKNLIKEIKIAEEIRKNVDASSASSNRDSLLKYTKD